MKIGSGKLLFHILAILIVAIWGVTFISSKILLDAGVSPAWIFAIRFSLAYVGICIFSLCRKKPLFSKSIRDELIFMILGITGGSLYFITENTALTYTQASNVSFIVCSAPLFTMLLTVAIKKRCRGWLADGLEDVEIGWKLTIGTVVTLIGMALVIFDGARPALSITGDLLSLCASLCWCIYSVLMGQMAEKYSATMATRKVFFYGLVTIMPFLHGELPEMSVMAQPAVWGNLLFLSLIASFGCFIGWNVVMFKLGNVTSTNYVYFNPFFTLVAGILILGEALTLQSAIGSIAIVAGVYVAGRKASSRT